MFLLSFGSGVAALIYEVVWFQLLELVIGASTISVAVILASFMGGTCLGSLIFPRLVSIRWNPLRTYAVIELGIGVFGLVLLLLMPVLAGIYSSWAGDGVRSFLLRGVVAAICLLAPTVLMGATLPALSRCVERSSLGYLYSGNIGGAVFGCLIAGFYLLRQYDVTTATYVAAAVNAIVAATAFALAPQTFKSVVSRHGTRSVLSDAAPAEAGVYVVIALSGLCAMAAETVWTRILALLMGGSVYTFSIILAVFLLGLGLGSGIGSLLSRNVSRLMFALGCCQLLTAAAIAWTAHSLTASLPSINPDMSPNIWFTFQLDFDRALWALLPPTLLWGASFTLALAATANGKEDSGTLMSRIYAANTLGAIAGALGASLLLIARIGSQRIEQLLIALSAAAGLLLLLRVTRAWVIAGAVVSVAAAALLINTVPPIAKVLIAYGRYASSWVNKSDIVYAEEGIAASVAVSKFPNGAMTFHVAGKIQASSVARDMRLQRMLGHLTSLVPAKPHAVLVIGCGAGITAGAVSLDPEVEHLKIVELEPLVPEVAEKYFSKFNFDVIRSPKVRVHIDDGRHFVLTTKERFDAITLDPLDPWVKGAATLYTKEFFEAARRRLNPGGVITVYVQLFETNLEAVKSTVATFFEAFPNGTIWGNTYEGKGHDMILLGQVEPTRIDLNDMERRVSSSRIEQSLSDVGMNSALDLFATYAGRRPDLTKWVAGAAINLDRNLRMQYLAGLGLDLDNSAAIYADMLTHRRFPEDVFTGTQAQLDSLRTMIQKE
ncbi:MAG TPA: fused MFS/spermidine synthase [Terriglobia bacterium]|nr:fused MFS/spermidine synthase [Terriglobia bacterium]